MSNTDFLKFQARLIRSWLKHVHSGKPLKTKNELQIEFVLRYGEELRTKFCPL